MSEPAVIPVDSVAPVLLVDDIHRSVQWYTEKAGFSVDKIWGDPPSFAMARRGGVIIMLKESDAGPRANAAALPNMWDAYIRVKSMEETMKALIANGVEDICGPEKTPYDCEEITVRDPDGHILCFGHCW
ncbi:MAG: VOC family protein [Parvularculaceae bacterium]